jgi:hypothetical protein
MIELWLISALLIKHFFCDYPFQTKQMLDDKSYYLQLWGVLHACVHGAGTMVVFMAFGFYGEAVVLAFFDVLIHYHIDFLRSKVNKWTNNDRGQEYWDSHGLDQLAHGLTYVLLVFVALSVSIKA